MNPAYQYTVSFGNNPAFPRTLIHHADKSKNGENGVSHHVWYTLCMPTHAKLLQLKIILIGSKPAIWRELVVPGNYSLFDLHAAIQDAFAWHDCHLHQYFTESPYQRNSGYERIAVPMPELDDVIDERKEKLSAWFRRPKNALWYEYDFGDRWMHEVTLEKTLPPHKTFKVPLLLDGARACPPDDCGGIGGYYDLLETLASPKSPDHKDMLEWMGIETAAEFDPEKFDKKKVKFHNPKRRLKAFMGSLRL